MSKRVVIGVLCLILLLFGVSAAAFAEAEASAKLIELDGDVQVLRGGGEKPFKAFLNMRIAEGDRIITGLDGAAKVEMEEGIIITLAENTKVYLSELRDANGASQSSISLQSGGIGSSLKSKLKDNSRFEIKTPTAVMGVRGTEFFAQYSNGSLDLRVVDGVVEVKVGVSGTGEVAGYGGSVAETQVFSVSELEQVSISEGKPARELSEAIEPLKLQGLSLPFLNRVREISQENPEAIPAGVMDTMEEAVEGATRALEEKANNPDLVPDELDATVEKPVTGTIQASAPATTTAPPVPVVVPSGSSSSSSGGGDTTPDPVVPQEPQEPIEPDEPGGTGESQGPTEPEVDITLDVTYSDGIVSWDPAGDDVDQIGGYALQLISLENENRFTQYIHSGMREINLVDNLANYQGFAASDYEITFLALETENSLEPVLASKTLFESVQVTVDDDLVINGVEIAVSETGDDGRYDIAVTLGDEIDNNTTYKLAVFEEENDTSTRWNNEGESRSLRFSWSKNQGGTDQYTMQINAVKIVETDGTIEINVAYSGRVGLILPEEEPGEPELTGSVVVTDYDEMLVAAAASEVTEIVINGDIIVLAVEADKDWSIEVFRKKIIINEGKTLTLAGNSRMAYDTIDNNGDIVIEGSSDNRGYLQGGNILGSGMVRSDEAGLSIEVDSEEALRNALRFQTYYTDITIVAPLVIDDDLDVPKENWYTPSRQIFFSGNGSLSGSEPGIELVLYWGDSIIINNENSNFYYHGGTEKITGEIPRYGGCTFIWRACSDGGKWIENVLS